MCTVGKKATFNAYPRTDFCFARIQNGAKCEILEIKPNTAIVRFDGHDETDIVALGYLKGKSK